MFECSRGFLGFRVILEHFGECVLRGRMCLNVSHYGVKELFNLELNKCVWERDTVKVSILCRSGLCFCLFQRLVI